VEERRVVCAGCSEREEVVGCTRDGGAEQFNLEVTVGCVELGSRKENQPWLLSSYCAQRTVTDMVALDFTMVLAIRRRHTPYSFLHFIPTQETSFPYAPRTIFECET